MPAWLQHALTELKSQRLHGKNNMPQLMLCGNNMTSPHAAHMLNMYEHLPQTTQREVGHLSMEVVLSPLL